MAVSRIGSWSSGTATTLSHTNGVGSNRVMIVAVGVETAATVTVTAIDYGGQALTRKVFTTAGTGYSYQLEIWILDEAGIQAATSTTITPTISGAYDDIMIAAATFGGVNQTTPVVETNSDATAAATPNPLTGGDIVEAVGNAIVAAGGCGNATSATWNTPMTEQTDVAAASSALSTADRLSTTSANVDIECTWASQNRAALVSVEFQAAEVSPWKKIIYTSEPPTPNAWNQVKWVNS